MGRFLSDEQVKEAILFCGGEPSQFNNWLNKPKTFAELLVWDNGKTIEWGDIPGKLKHLDGNDFHTWMRFDHKYETADISNIADYVYDYLPEEHPNYEDETHDLELISKVVEETFPGLCQWLVDNEVTTITFDW